MATWVAYAATVFADLSGRRIPAWIAASAGTLTLLLSLPGYLSTYWEILPDRLVEHRLLGRSVLMHIEIVALTPLSIASGENEILPDQIEVRGVAGRRMLVDTTDPHGFLDELLEHLPPIAR